MTASHIAFHAGRRDGLPQAAIRAHALSGSPREAAGPFVPLFGRRAIFAKRVAAFPNSGETAPKKRCGTSRALISVYTLRHNIFVTVNTPRFCVINMPMESQKYILYRVTLL
jgi:hypothetical protein